MHSRLAQLFRFLTLVGLVPLTGIQVAHACSCGPRPTVLDSYDSSDVVAILRVASVEKAGDNYVDGVRSATLVVEKVFKGNLKVNDQVVFAQGGGADCVWTFNEK